MKISDIRKIDGSLLLVFRELLRCHNVTETAKRLALSQSAVSQSLARLRDLFDDELFLRRSHGLEPTRKAIELGPQIDDLVQMLERALGKKEFDPAASSRYFALSAPEYVAAQVTPYLETLFRRYAPSASFWFKYLSPQDAFAALTRYETDIAIGRFGSTTEKNIRIERLYEDEFCLVARRDHPEVGRSISMKRLYDFRYVFAASPSELTPAEIRADYEGFKTAAVVPQWLTALVAVATTDLLTICPRRFAESQAKVLPIKVLSAPFPTISFDVDIASRANDTDEADAWFRGHLYDAVRP